MASPQTARITVLLCDDTRDILMLLGAEFDLHPDLEVIAEAVTGRECVDLAEELQPDVIVLDLAMPVMDGLQALPVLKEVAPTAKVVVLSAFEARSLESKALALGAQRFLEKGTPAAEIAMAVREVADGF